MELRYLISKYLHTSYTDTAAITPTEREILLLLIIDDLKRLQEAVESAKSGKNN